MDVRVTAVQLLTTANRDFANAINGQWTLVVDASNVGCWCQHCDAIRGGGRSTK